MMLIRSDDDDEERRTGHWGEERKEKLMVEMLFMPH
jgi:hypothetical protein